MPMAHKQFKTLRTTFELKLRPLTPFYWRDIEKFDIWMQAYKKIRGGHMNDIIFHL